MAKGVSRKCEQCGKTIPKARLEAVPHTKFCVKCADTAGEDIPREYPIDSYNSEDCLDILSGDD